MNDLNDVVKGDEMCNNGVYCNIIANCSKKEARIKEKGLTVSEMSEGL